MGESQDKKMLDKFGAKRGHTFGRNFKQRGYWIPVKDGETYETIIDTLAGNCNIWILKPKWS